MLSFGVEPSVGSQHPVISACGPGETLPVFGQQRHPRRDTRKRMLAVLNDLAARRHFLCVAIGIPLFAACGGSGSRTVAPTVANPTVSGVKCSDQWTTDADASTPDGICRAMFDDCTDGLTYELDCQAHTCDCIVDGDRQAAFEPVDGFQCDTNISQLKVLCGWNSADGSKRIRVPD
jgi:hypothetical protein